MYTQSNDNYGQQQEEKMIFVKNIVFWNVISDELLYGGCKLWLTIKVKLKTI